MNFSYSVEVSSFWISDLKYTKSRLDVPNYKVYGTKSAYYAALPHYPLLLWGSEATSFICKIKMQLWGLWWAVLLTAAPRPQGVKGSNRQSPQRECTSKSAPHPPTKKIKNKGIIPYTLCFPGWAKSLPQRWIKLFYKETGKSDSLWGKEGLLERESALGQSYFT